MVGGMAAKKDFSQHALSIVEQATGDGPLVDTPEKSVSQTVPLPEKPKNRAAVELGRLGGLKGGKKRAEGMTAAERREAGRKAARARWDKS